MVSRILAGAVALFALGSFAAPIPASAKGGFAGHAGFAVRPAIAVHKPFFNPHGFFVPRALLRPHGLGFNWFALRRNRFPSTTWSWGFDAIGPYAYDYPSYAQTGDASVGAQSAPPPPPAAADGAQPRPVVVYRPGCRTQTQTVPSEFSGTRTINITRCY